MRGVASLKSSIKKVHAVIKVFESVKAAIVLEWPFLFVSLQSRAKSNGKEEEKGFAI